jgi:hypothetical protein
MSYALSLDELCRLGTKYALCPEMAEPPLAELKERFASFEWCADKATAAAFGYYAAMEELNGGKIVVKDIYDQCAEVVEDACSASINTSQAVDRLLTLVYHWLDKELESEGWKSPDYGDDTVRGDIYRLFEASLIDEEHIKKYQK